MGNVLARLENMAASSSGACRGPLTSRRHGLCRLRGGRSESPDSEDTNKNRYGLYKGEKEGEVGPIESMNSTDVRSGSDATGMTSSVDPMVIDDDIFDDKSVSDKEEVSHVRPLGNPPEPPSKKVVYIPNSLDEEDEEGADDPGGHMQQKINMQSKEMKTSDVDAILDGLSPAAAISTSIATSDAREAEPFEEMRARTAEAPSQSHLLKEALEGAIEQHKGDPAFVPSITQAIRSTFGPYRFKGFGYSCMKPLNKLPSVGLGLRIPVSPCFPQYDANVGLPRLSSMLSWWITDEETYLRLSFSTSLPSRVFFYYLTLLGFKVRLLPRTYSENIRSRRATDSVKRVGCTVSIRLGSQTGLRWAIGPWLFYLPGKKVMSKVLPVVFSSPAVVLAALNLVLDMESALENLLDLDPATFRNRHSVARSRSYDEPPIDIDDDIVVGPTSIEERDAAVSAVAAGLEDAPLKYVNTYQSDDGIYEGSLDLQRVIELLQLLPSDIALWHSRLLRWAATKTTGLGFNAGYSKTQKQDASMRQSIAFDIQPFFPSLDLVPMVVHRVSEVAKKVGNVVVQRTRSSLGGQGGDNEGEEEDLYSSSQLNQVRYQHKKVRSDSHEREELKEKSDTRRPEGVNNNRRGGLKRRSSGRPIKARAKKKAPEA